MQWNGTNMQGCIDTAYLHWLMNTAAEKTIIGLTRLHQGFFSRRFNELYSGRLKTAAETRGGSTARIDILVSGSLGSTYTWSRYEVTIDGNWIDDGLGGILTGLAGIFLGDDWCRSTSVGTHISKNLKGDLFWLIKTNCSFERLNRFDAGWKRGCFSAGIKPIQPAEKKQRLKNFFQPPAARPK